MIRHFSVTNLNGRLTFELDFHRDLNIVTGKNGSGKTTLLKLLWFMLSGNVERIPAEVSFSNAALLTDRFSLNLEFEERGDVPLLNWHFQSKAGMSVKGKHAPHKIDRLNRLIVEHSPQSLFFPTFRRIEGGFAMSRRMRRVPDGSVSVYYETSLGIESALSDISRSLSVGPHRFVAAISTTDIVHMLTSQYANVSEQLNEAQRHLSADIFSTISRPDSGVLETLSDADKTRVLQSTLDSIRAQVNLHTQRQDELLRPFSALSDLVGRMFQHKGIAVTTRLTLGDATAAIASEKLSAGEKQMLSFLVYNAFESESVIFIDEPEISLHVDWQRQLFPTLLEQGGNNQFVVATHSPFIYSRYADRELILDADRGE